MTKIKEILLASTVFFLSFFSWKSAKAQMEFIENKGQWHSNIQYQSNFNSGNFYLEEKGFTVALHDTADLSSREEFGHTTQSHHILHSFAYKVKFLGAADAVKLSPEKPLSTYNNYFLGNDSKKWAANCKIFQAVTYKNVYPNIDIRYYSDGQTLKYDFLVYPGGNVSAIAVQYDGPQLILKDKQLIIKTSVGDVKELAPYSFQTSDNTKQEVECKYVLKNNVLTFDIKKYNTNQLLIIDPALVFATYTGSKAENWGFTATPGPDGSLYAGGIAFADGAEYPVSPGAYQTVSGGGPEEDGTQHGYDIAIFKFSPDGVNRMYATYLGGNGNEQPHSMIADAAGNLIVEGRTNSGNFPVTGPVIGSGGLYDITITKFNAAGNALLGSVKIGGTGDDGVNISPKYRPAPIGAVSLRQNYGDDSRSEVILDNSNNIIVVGCTQSADFPVAGASLNAPAGFRGAQDGVILKFNSNLSNYLYGSYFGGSGDDGCFVTAVNKITGRLYVAGGTTSSDLPGNTSGVIQNGNAGGLTDGFVTEIDLTNNTIVKTTYIGTSGTDLIFGLKFDRKGFPYIMGTTTGTWNVTPAGIFSNPNSGQFIAKLQPDLSQYIYSTCFGTGGRLPNISPIAFLVDRCENVYVSGWGGGLNTAGPSSQHYDKGNTNGLPEVDPLPGIPGPDGADFYFFVLKKNAQGQLFGSHFGQYGQLGDHVDGGTSRFDDNGVIYQAVCACSNDYNTQIITTPGVWSRKSGSLSCNEALLKIRMDFAGVGAGLQTEIDGVKYDTAGCAPLNVIFRDTLLLGKTYYWDFGDGSPVFVTTNPNTQHPYNIPGWYHVMLIAEDVNTCNVRDTAYVTIRVGNNKASLDFSAKKDTPCTSTTYTFFNNPTATFPTPGFQQSIFTWDYGDGSAPEVSFNGRHTFPGPGKYKVTLTLSDTNYCNSPVEFSDTLRVFPLVKSAFKTPQLGCAPYYAKFNFTGGEAGTDFFYSFGDGSFSTDTTDANPTHLYASPGVYNVRLIVRDTNTCNKIDTSAYFKITVLEKPVAKFTWSPDPPQRNTATQFTNLSVGAVRYLWEFGEEGETSTETNPRHQFNSTGSFTVKLTAYNQNNCDSSVSLTVSAIVDPLLDVPNAFTPGRFGVNGYVFVKGYGIGKMDWKIYNRWGQMVYHQTNRKSLGWDGTFKGKLQPMDVYAYTLDVVFTDGKKLRKTGDITLLR